LIEQEWKRFHPSVAHNISGAFDAAIRVCLEWSATRLDAHKKRGIAACASHRHARRNVFAAHRKAREIDFTDRRI
jgi:hypothetical protein